MTASDNQLTTANSYSAVGPVTTSERIAMVDVLRGVALLGILVINIEFFALPSAMLFSPDLAGGFSGINLLVWQFGYLLFFEKMMAIFSMLFGAGLILMFRRAEAAQKKLGGVYYRRVLWLMLIGLAHAYLLWYGDILFTYAICGLLLYLFRRRSARALMILGFAILMVGMGIQSGIGVLNGSLRDSATTYQTARDNGKTLTPQQESIIETWTMMESMFKPSPKEVQEEIAVYQGGFAGIFRFRGFMSLMMQTQAMVFMVFWRAMGLMLLGMAFMKLGIFSGGRSLRFYAGCIVVGYGIGLPVVWYGMSSLQAHGFDIVYRFLYGNHFNYAGSILVALAHVSVVVIIVKFGVLNWLTSRLAAVGRMALSNYLIHSIICTTIFYGYGFGLFGKVERLGLLGIVVAILVLQLIVSPIWLTYFRFGPFEWLWRSLTYWRLQPMRPASGENR